MRKALAFHIENSTDAWAWLEGMARAGLLFSPEISASEFIPTGKRKPFSGDEAKTADALMQQAILVLGFDTVLGIVAAHKHRLAIEARFGKVPKIAVVESCSDFKPAVAFFHHPSGLWISRPRESPDGKQYVDPVAYYGIAEELACAIENANGRAWDIKE